MNTTLTKFKLQGIVTEFQSLRNTVDVDKIAEMKNNPGIPFNSHEETFITTTLDEFLLKVETVLGIDTFPISFSDVDIKTVTDIRKYGTLYTESLEQLEEE